MKVLFKEYIGDKEKSMQGIKNIRDLTGLDLAESKKVWDNLLLYGRAFEYEVPLYAPPYIFKQRGFVVDFKDFNVSKISIFEDLVLLIIRLLNNGQYECAKQLIDIIENNPGLKNWDENRETKIRKE